MKIYTDNRELKIISKEGLDMILWNEGLTQFNFMFSLNCDYIGYVIEDEEDFEVFKRILDEDEYFIEKVRQNYIEGQWLWLSYVNVNQENCIDVEFLMWKCGTSIQEIWGWFNINFHKGIHYLHENIA